MVVNTLAVCTVPYYVIDRSFKNLKTLVVSYIFCFQLVMWNYKEDLEK